MSQSFGSQGGHLGFSNQPEIKHELSRRLWDLASCQVSLNSIQRFQRRSGKCPIGVKNTNFVEDVAIFLQVKIRRKSLQRRSRKCLSQSKARVAILFFRSVQKNTNVLKDFEILLPVKLRCIPFSGFREVEHVSANKRPGRPSWISDRPENTNLVEDVEVLLPFKYRWIQFSAFREEVENVSTNQRPGRPSWISDRPEKHKRGSGRWDFASRQVSLNSVKCFQRRNRKCLSQSEARAAILVFLSVRKTQTWQMTLRSYFLSSFAEFG